MKKLFWSLLFICGIIIGSQIYALDFNTVLDRMHTEGLTKYNTIDAFRPDDAITRGESAKFVNQYAQFMKLDKNYTACDFADITDYDYTLVPHIAEACSYGLLKGSQGNFMPRKNITEAQGMTVVMRSLYGFQDETKSPWYQQYYNLGKQAGITTDTNINELDNVLLTRAKLGTRFYLAAHLGQNTETLTDGIKTELGEEVVNTKISGYLDYDADKVTQALNEGQYVILFFYAEQCTSCALLHDNLLANNNLPSTLAIFKVDYNIEEDLKNTYNITTPHTIIKLNNNKQETKRDTTATTFEDLRKNLIEGPKI